jgi:DNA-binding LytR/AlgR family response regulator
MATKGTRRTTNGIMNTGKLMLNDMILLGQGWNAATVRVGDISVVEVDGNDLTVRRNGGEPITTRCSLARCKQRLPKQFFAAGRNCMVNLAEVAKVNMASRTFVLTMKDGTRVTMSRIASALFRKELLL